MKKSLRVIAAVVAVMLLVGITGCGNSQKPTKDLSKVVAATYGDEKIYLDEANFFLRYTQWTYESMYWDVYTQLMGYTDIWEIPFDENGKTMADSIKESTMQQLHQTRVLCDAAAQYGLSMDSVDVERCKEAAHEIFAETDPSFFEYAPVTEEQLTEWFKLNALANMVHQTIIDGVEVTVNEDDYAMFEVTYINIATDATVKVTDEKGEEQILLGVQVAKAITDRVNAGEDFETVATEYELKPTSATYAKKEADTDTEFTKNARQLLTSSDKAMQFTNSATEELNVMICSNPYVEDASEEKRVELEQEQKDLAFNAIYVPLQDAAPEFKVTSDYENLKVGGGEKIYVEPATEEGKG
ncbi:MAG: hypothetical protein KBS79_03545 [Lachnospiraceae bacterium]|nr:hypothetical protein [Candidatus Minthocola equi]